MIRNYAIGIVAGTQVFTLGIGGAIFGTGDLTTALLLAAAWGSTWQSPNGRSASGPAVVCRRVGPGGSAMTERIAPSDQVSGYELSLDGHLDDHWYDWSPA
jgi:hypothetical protein